MAMQLSQQVTSDQHGLTEYDPSQLQQEMWGGLLGAYSQMLWPGGGGLQAPQYNGQLTAPQTAAMEGYLGHAMGQGLPDYSGYQSGLGGLNSQMMGGMQDPNSINFSNNYNPSQFNVPQFSMNDPLAGYNGGGQGMQVQAPGGIGTSAGAYQYNVDQVHAPNGVQAQQISGLPQVSGPNLQNYQMGAYDKVQAPGNIQSFNIDPSQLGGGLTADKVGTQSWTAPGTAQKFMDPYTQNVVDQQKAQATRDYQAQLVDMNAQAAQAGAFGGSRQAVLQGTAMNDLANRMAGIEASGLQSAYQSGQQQFNTEQGQGLQAQLANQQAGLQAGQFNQQQLGTIALANQQAQLQAQGLGTNTNLQAQLANQQAGLNTNTQNLQSLLQTQGLGAQLGMQGQLANQQMAWNAANANATNNLQAGMFNNQQDMQAQLANQGANAQMNQYATGLGFQGAQQAGNWGLQAQLANQQAQQNQYNRALQGMTTQYGGNLQSGLQGQQLGLQAQQYGEQANQFGAGLNLQTQQQQQAARNALMNTNLGYYQQGAANIGQQAGLANQGFQNDLARTQAMGLAAQTDQNYAQQQADRNYAYWQYQQQYPYQALSSFANVLQAMPQQGAVQTTQQGQTNYYTPKPSILNQAVGLGGQFVGSAMKAYAGGA